MCRSSRAPTWWAEIFHPYEYCIGTKFLAYHNVNWIVSCFRTRKIKLKYQVRTIFWHNRWSGAVLHGSNWIKRSNLQKRDKKFPVLRCVGVWKKEFLFVLANLQAKSQKPWKISLSYSFAVEMGHFDMVRWKYDSICIFSMLRDTVELILWKKAAKKCKDQKRSIFSRRVLW